MLTQPFGVFGVGETDSLNRETERQEKELGRLLEWIGKADAKAQILIGANLAMIGAVMALTPDEARKNWGALLLVAIACALPVFSLYQCFAAAMPHVDGPEKSLIFFEPIASFAGSPKERECKEKFKRGCQGYSTELAARTEESYLSDLNAQCLINAIIASAKYRRIKRAWYALFIGAFIWIGAILVLYKVFDGKSANPPIAITKASAPGLQSSNQEGKTPAVPIKRTK